MSEQNNPRTLPSSSRSSTSYTSSTARKARALRPTLQRKSAHVTLKNREIRRVFKQGKSFVNQYFVVYILPDKKSISRVGFCTGKAAGHAVKRNRIRRRTKELFRLIAKDLPVGYSLVIIARPRVYAADFKLLKRALQELFRQAGLVITQQLSEDMEKWRK